MKSKNQKSSHVAHRTPRFESLEHRQMMAGLTMNFDMASKTLIINGTAASDSIAIVQSDASNKLSVNAKSGSDAPIARTFPSNLVNRLFVQLGAGDDQFTFQTKGDVWNRKEMQLNLGEGDDMAKVGWADDRSMALGNLSIVVSGGAGSDAFGARIGRMGFNVATTVNADMGSGDDGFVVQALNPGLALSRLTIASVGGDGDDHLQFFGSELIASRAKTDLRFDGQAGNDLLEFYNLGRIDGQLTETLIGGEGAHWGHTRVACVLNTLGSHATRARLDHSTVAIEKMLPKLGSIQSNPTNEPSFRDVPIAKCVSPCVYPPRDRYSLFVTSMLSRDSF